MPTEVNLPLTVCIFVLYRVLERFPSSYPFPFVGTITIYLSYSELIRRYNAPLSTLRLPTTNGPQTTGDGMMIAKVHIITSIPRTRTE